MGFDESAQGQESIEPFPTLGLLWKFNEKVGLLTNYHYHILSPVKLVKAI